MINNCNILDKNRIIELGKLITDNFDKVNNVEEIIKNKEIIGYYINNRLVGYIIFKRMYDITDLIYIIVDTEYRRQKIASKLLEYLIEESEKILLEVRCDNDNAIKLYKNYNFKIINIRKKYYNNVDGYVVDVMKDVYILGIESSCDETSISIVKNGYIEIATTISTQMDTHAMYGGVVPEIASRMHTENITLVLSDLLKKANMKISEVDAIAVTYAPGLLGSLLVGIEFAKTLSLVYNKPLIKVHHISGHIFANNLVKKIEYPTLALVVSGGHTELVEMTSDYDFKVIGTTKDDAIGECFDKVARVLDLKYPGGPNIERLALLGHNTYTLPIPMNNNELDFSFSGLKSAVINLVHNEKQRGNEIRKEDLANSFQTIAVDEIVRKTNLAIKKTGIKRLIVAGGVSANNYLRKKLENLCNEINVDLSIPPLKYCTDNATMIACAAYPLYLKGEFSDFTLNGKSQEYFFKN